MKKIISIVMVVAMLFASVAALAVNSSAKYLDGETGIDYV